MNELTNVTNQTPIEIALGIDENGMTTATKLYEFLELNPSNYSKWCKTNILENGFTEENIDYFPFVLKYESLTGEKERQDFKLTASFAKKLSMTQKNERGEEARNYFLKVEDKLKEVSIKVSELPPELQMFKNIFDQQARQYLEIQQIKKEQQEVNNRIESIKDVVSMDTTSWREDTGRILNTIGISLGGGMAYQNIRSESYKLLNKRMGVDLEIRLTNLRNRMAGEGISKSKRDKMSYLDVIERDKKLIEGYTAIVKEMAIKYGIA